MRLRDLLAKHNADLSSLTDEQLNALIKDIRAQRAAGLLPPESKSKKVRRKPKMPTLEELLADDNTPPQN